jgi:hypothetical protein
MVLWQRRAANRRLAAARMGTQPNVSNTTADDLNASVDFRSVYSELLQKVLRTDPGRGLTGSHPELGILA